MACAGAWDDPDMSIDEVVKNAKTGDLIEYKGRGLDAKFIQCMSGVCSGYAKNSHVGVVVEIGKAKRKAVTEAYPTVIGKDLLTGEEHTGVQVVDLRARIASYPSGHVMWRPMSKRKGKTSDASDRFVRYYRRLVREGLPQYNLGGRCFLATGMDWFEYSSMTDGDDNGGRYVCTQWSMQVLRVMGMARGDNGPGNVSFYELSVGQPPGLILEHYEYGPYHIVDTSEDHDDGLGAGAAPSRHVMRK